MALYDMGYGFAKLGEGLSSGMLSGKLTDLTLQEKEKDRALKERALGIQEKRYDAQSQAAKGQSDYKNMQMKQTFVKTMKELLEVTPDEQMEQFASFYNTEAPKVGLPPVQSFQRVGKNKYHIVDSEQGLFAFDSSTMNIEPLKSGGAQLQSGKIQKWEEPYTDKAGNTLQKSNRGRVARITPAGQEEFTDPYQDEAGNTVQRGDRTGKVRKISGPAKTEKPAMNPAQAEKRITDLTIAKTKVGKDNLVDKLLAQTLGLQEGQPLSDDDRKVAIGRIDEEIATLQQYRQKGQPAASSPDLSQVTSALQGRPAGRRYRVGGVVYQWDGTKAVAE